MQIHKETTRADHDTGVKTEEDENDYNGSQSNEESKTDDKRDDDSDNGEEDGNIDMEVDGNTWEEVIKMKWCAIGPPTKQTAIAGK